MYKHNVQSALKDFTEKQAGARALKRRLDAALRDLHTPGKFTPQHIAAETRRLLADAKDQADALGLPGTLARLVALKEAPVLSRRAAVRQARHTPAAVTKDRWGDPLADEAKRSATQAADMLEALTGLRVALTLSRTTDDDLRDLLGEAVAAGNQALLAELSREAHFRAAELQTPELRFLAGEIDATINTVDLPEVVEAEQLRRHVEAAATDLGEVVRALEAGDVDRSERWQAARAIDPDAPRSRPLVIEDGVIALHPADRPAAA